MFILQKENSILTDNENNILVFKSFDSMLNYLQVKFNPTFIESNRRQVFVYKGQDFEIFYILSAKQK